MDNQSTTPGSLCCSLAVLVGISVILIEWDISVVTAWSEELSGLDYLGQAWLLATCLMITYLWFSIPITICFICCNCLLPIRWIGYSLLFIFGPNLLLWNIIGCICDTIEYKGFCKSGDCQGNILVIVLKTITWLLFYAVAVLLTSVLLVPVCRYIRDAKQRNRVKKWRNKSQTGIMLLEMSCPICLDGFLKGEKLQTLSTCNHSFHSECIEIWLHDHSTCPVCRNPCINE